MKLRNGFVSNSSSSSFVAVITKTAFDEALEKADPYTKAVIEAMKADNDIIAGIPVKILGTYDSHGCTPFDYLDIEYEPFENEATNEDEEIYPSEVFHNFISSIPVDQIICHDQDM